jgi:hypothetical protein
MGVRIPANCFVISGTIRGKGIANGRGLVVLGLVDHMEADIDDQVRDDRLYERPVLYYN